MEGKQWYKSKRFWSGVLSLITGISLIVTGEKTAQEVIPELVLTAFGLVQFIFALISGQTIDFGSKTLAKK